MTTVKIATLLALIIASPLDELVFAMFLAKSRLFPLAMLAGLIAIVFHLVRMRRRMQ